MRFWKRMDKSGLRHYLVGDFSWNRVVRSSFLAIGLVYICLLIYGYFFTDLIIFQPPPSGYRDTKEILKLETDDGERISAVYLPNADSVFTILYSHGNGEDLGDVRSILESFRKNGYSVLAYDYRGYGTSTGTPSESGVYRDIDAAYGYMTGELGIAPDRIIAYGRSLGGGVATDLASRHTLAGLILESSFVTAFRVSTHVSIVPFDKFGNIDKIQKVQCPLLIMHSRDDELVRFWHGEALYEVANEPKLSLWVDGVGHDGIPWVEGDSYWKSIDQFTTMITRNTLQSSHRVTP